MKFRWNSRLTSHLAAAILVLLLWLLSWRMTPDTDWIPNLGMEPLFESGEMPSLRDVIEPEEESRAEDAPASEANKPAAAAPPPDLEAELLYEEWSRARQLLRLRDLDGAESVYRDLTERWPRHPDLAGELGNVYVLLGDEDSARIMFSRAQRLLRPMGPSMHLEAVTHWLLHHP